MKNILKRNKNGDALTPKQIVDYLDKYIIGQEKAKRAVAISLRNRWRRKQLPPEIAEEIIPKNILIIGPTVLEKLKLPEEFQN